MGELEEPKDRPMGAHVRGHNGPVERSGGPNPRSNASHLEAGELTALAWSRNRPARSPHHLSPRADDDVADLNAR
jgi:hypothetical protein